MGLSLGLWCFYTPFKLEIFPTKLMVLHPPKRLWSFPVGAFLLLLQGSFSWVGAEQTLPQPMTMAVEALPPTAVALSFDAPLKPAQDYLPPAPAPKATHLVLSLSQKRVYVLADEKVLDQFPVAVGAPATPTPAGEFEIFQMIVDPVWESPWTGEVHPPGPDSALGLRWIGFVTQENGIIGFHGTPTVGSIGQAVSNGCVRLRNEDVLALYAHVHMGMRVIVDP
jgi:lipoprotein-anchoring transpeptidase ErfK/SrfK